MPTNKHRHPDFSATQAPTITKTSSQHYNATGQQAQRARSKVVWSVNSAVVLHAQASSKPQSHMHHFTNLFKRVPVAARLQYTQPLQV
jgi:hypothetical protein